MGCGDIIAFPDFDGFACPYFVSIISAREYAYVQMCAPRVFFVMGNDSGDSLVPSIE